MIDVFKSFATSLTAPATRIEEITPNDSADLALVTRALNVAQSGYVRLTTIDGDTSDIYIAAGAIFPVRAMRIWATGTTATGLRGLS